jgi:hypothetical protein
MPLFEAARKVDRKLIYRVYAELGRGCAAQWACDHGMGLVFIGLSRPVENCFAESRDAHPGATTALAPIRF